METLSLTPHFTLLAFFTSNKMVELAIEKSWFFVWWQEFTLQLLLARLDHNQ